VAPQLLAQTGVEDAKRNVLGLALVIVLFALAGKLFSFGSLIVQGGQSQPAISVTDLESRLKEQNVFGRVGDARTKLSCEQARLQLRADASDIHNASEIRRSGDEQWRHL
jgi:hypothetical protein